MIPTLLQSKKKTVPGPYPGILEGGFQFPRKGEGVGGVCAPSCAKREAEKHYNFDHAFRSQISEEFTHTHIEYMAVDLNDIIILL